MPPEAIKKKRDEKELSNNFLLCGEDSSHDLKGSACCKINLIITRKDNKTIQQVLKNSEQFKK